MLVEEAFSLPGIGQLLADSITYKDIPVVQAIVLIVAALIMTTTLVVDIVARILDPRPARGRAR